MRLPRDLAPLLLILLVGAGLRAYKPWTTVFQPGGVDFLETDAWYHVRLVENQVRNFPWRVTRDPYAAPDGQFVPIAPLLDAIVATAAWATGGRAAPLHRIEFVAALVPPLFGLLTVVAAWALAHVVFGRREALLAALCTAVWPGHFLDRTLVGFVDHHALEAFFATATLAAVAWAARAPGRFRLAAAAAALGAYLLSWASGAFLVGVLAAWLAGAAIALRDAAALTRAARVAGATAAGALLMVLAFQDPGLHRYATQVVSLAGLGVLAAVVGVPGPRLITARAGALRAAAVLASLTLAAYIGARALAPDFVAAVTIDLARFAPSPERMAVLEARPLFLYAGQWTWSQPWVFFRTGFYLGVLALVVFLPRLWRRREAGDLLIWLWTLAALAATIGQNRFGYYLVPAAAVLSAWLAIRILDWGGVPHRDDPAPVVRPRLPFQREIAVILVAGAFVAPALVPAFRTTARGVRMPDYWRAAMHWLRDRTPEPFPPGYYLARYPRGAEVRAAWTVMNWWDQGYWIVQTARRVPVSNPTQARAGEAARFYVATTDADARARLDADRVRYVVTDWEKPFRREGGAIMGHFESLTDWSGERRDRFYQVYWRRGEDGGFSPLWTFTLDYYRTMAYRLTVLGGRPAPAADRPHVLSWRPVTDVNGQAYRELVTLTPASSLAAAEAHRATLGDGNHVIVGLDPWRAPIPLDGVPFLRLVHDVRTPDPGPDRAPWVRIYEVIRP
ncbi:MAG: STT3 domain-containing protein [Acidobacteriota bacterium]